MLTILHCQVNFNRVLKLLNLKLVKESRLQSIKIFLPTVILKYGQKQKKDMC